MRTVPAAALCLLTLLLPQAAAHHLDVEPNDSCGAANATASSYAWPRMGSVSSSDPSDFFRLTVSSLNWEVWAELASPYGPNDYDLYLYDPSCGLLDSSLGVASSERVSAVSGVTGTYYVEVRWFSGSGDYDLDAGSNPQGATFCSVTAQAVTSPLDASCGLTTPSCAAACTIHYEAFISGAGVVSASYRSASCSGVLECTSTTEDGAVSEALPAGGSLTGVCRSSAPVDPAAGTVGVTGAANVVLVCTAWV